MISIPSVEALSHIDSWLLKFFEVALGALALTRLFVIGIKEIIRDIRKR
jgi:hypothetical protein